MEKLKIYNNNFVICIHRLQLMSFALREDKFLMLHNVQLYWCTPVCMSHDTSGQNCSSRWGRQVAKFGKAMMHTEMWLRNMFITYNVRGISRRIRGNNIKMDLSKTDCERGSSVKVFQNCVRRWYLVSSYVHFPVM